MDRRTALKYFAVSGAAAMFLPGCLTDKKKVSIALNNLQITPEDEELLAEIAETLIPGSDKPGARQVDAHLFALVMVDDCTSPSDKEKFTKGLKSFNTSFSDDEFLGLSREKKQEALSAFEKDINSKSEELQHFYKTAKGYIIYGYTTSQYFMTEVKPYKLVPGPVYKGCIPLSEKV